MGFQGRGGRGGFSRGGSSGGFSRGGRGSSGGFSRGGFRGGRGGFSQGPPEAICEAGEVMHECESQIVCKGTLNQQVPYFNGRVFLENKEEIGKVDEILGPINEMYFSVKLNEGIKAASIKPNTRFFIDTNQTLPLSRFLPKPSIAKGAPGEAKRGRGGSAGRGRGGRGGGGGGRGFSRGRFRGARGGNSRGFSRGRGRGS